MDGNAADDENETAMFSCLAITEKRPQSQRRPSGCTGIFYQLFDWNRRLARNSRKNKLNLISSATPKNSTSKRFGAHDKLLLPPPTASKFHLIAEENGGGFPYAKKHRMDTVQIHHKHEMRPPSLVAKLMGLDGIPTPNKHKQTRHCPNKMNEKLVDAHKHQDGIFAEELNNLDNNEPRPQKQQRTGQLDIHAVGMFGQDALQLKNVLSRSRKHIRSYKGGHHPNLPSPVKSPRARSGNNAARLIDAATKILEPRLRVSNRRANAITHPHYKRHGMSEQSVREGSNAKAPDFGMLSPCNKCGLPNGGTGVQQVAVEQLSPFQSPHKWPCRSMIEEDTDKPHELGKNKMEYVGSQSQDCIVTHRELVQENRSFFSQGQKARHFPSPPYESEVKLPAHSSNAFSPQQQKTNKTPFDRENISSKPTVSSLQSRRVTSAVNGITEIRETSGLSLRLSGRCKQKLPKRVDNEKFPQEMEQSTSKSQPKSPEQKRRIINTTGKVEHGPSSLDKPGSTEYHRLPSCSSSSQSRSSSNSKFGSPRTRKICSEPLLFTFLSPSKYESEIPLSKEKIGSATNRMVILKEKSARPVPAQPIPVSSDVLDTLLKQKLKELVQEQREQGIGGVQSKTSKILQELISALATEHHTSPDLIDTEFSKLHSRTVDSSFDNILHNHDHSPDTTTAEKAKDHLSPGSVLGASFSNSSCVSSSLDEYSEIILQNRLTDYAHCISPPSEPATQLKPVTSTEKKSSLDLFVKRISIMLEELVQRGATFSASKLSHTKEVVLHAGLVLENGDSTKAGRKEEFFICHFFDQLETFANAMWSNSKDPLSFNEGKDKTQLKGILLGLAVEYLDSRFGNNSNSIFDLRWRLPLKLTAQQLNLGLNNEITRWANLAGKTPDELIEWEVSQASGYWDVYEASGICCELDEEVLKALVEEIVVDLYQTN